MPVRFLPPNSAHKHPLHIRVPQAINAIHNQDCLVGLPSLDAKSIDMVLADLPYNSTRNKWDTPINLTALWAEFKRVVKPNGAIVLFAQAPFSGLLAASNLQEFRYE